MSDAANEFEPRPQPTNLRLASSNPNPNPLKGGGGGGTFDDMAWHDAVQRVDDKVDSNFKWTIGVFGGGFMVLLCAFAAGFLILSGKIEEGGNRSMAKLDTISSQLGDLKTDVAVLKVSQPSGKPR